MCLCVKGTGCVRMRVSYRGSLIGGCPSEVLLFTDVRQCVVSGDVLTAAMVGHPCTLTVVAKDSHAQQRHVGGDLFQAVITPSTTSSATTTTPTTTTTTTTTTSNTGVMIDLTDSNDGTYTGTYTPTTPGTYQLHVTLAQQPLTGSPFIITVHPRDKLVIINDSRILTTAELQERLYKMLPPNRHIITKLHDSINGAKNTDFWRVVNGKGRILVIGRTPTHVFGGYV